LRIGNLTVQVLSKPSDNFAEQNYRFILADTAG